MEKTPRVAVLLAEGFEEIEAVAVIDVLRRGGAAVRVASLGAADRGVSGAHQIVVMPDCSLDGLRAADLEMVVLPGGMPGSATLAADRRVLALLQAVHAAGGIVAAICAAPIALQAAGLLAGRRVTCYPSFESRLVGARVTGRTVENDARVITSRGPGTAIVFGLELLGALGRAEAADQLRQAMIVEA